MSHDFDRLTDRRGSNSLKWDVTERELPMWVADMDFETAPEITEALKKRAEHGIFGYTTVPEAWREAVAGWWQRRHNFEMDRDWLVFCTGVVPAVSSAVRKLTTAGEAVLVQPPVYNIFYNSICNNGRRVIENRLLYDWKSYRIDWKDLENKLKDPQTALMLLCKPQNPTGSIWSREELGRIGQLCAANHVTVISDEIHCDLTEPGYGYIPFASVSEECAQNSITCIAPTKAFNLAGLQTAAVAVPNEYLRHKMERALNSDEVAEPNAFAIDAAIAAFTQGEEWLDDLRNYQSLSGTGTAQCFSCAVPCNVFALAGLQTSAWGRGGAVPLSPQGNGPLSVGRRRIRRAWKPVSPYEYRLSRVESGGGAKAPESGNRRL